LVHLRPNAEENYLFAQKEQFIRREDRIFLRRVTGREHRHRLDSAGTLG
jgi:hypothetical protein